jgi:hypothetical protein
MDMVGRVRVIAAEHEAELAAGLTAAQHEQLIRLLRRVAGEQRLLATGMPGIPPGGPAAYGHPRLPHRPR